MPPTIITNDSNLGYSNSADYSTPRLPSFPSTASPRMNARGSVSDNRPPDIQIFPSRFDSTGSSSRVQSSPNGLKVNLEDGSDNSAGQLSFPSPKLRLDGKGRSPSSPGPSSSSRDPERDVWTPLASRFPGSPNNGRRKSSPGPRAVSRTQLEEPFNLRPSTTKRRTAISLSSIRFFLFNPLAIPSSHPYLRLAATFVVYGLALTVTSSWLTSSSVVADSAIMHRIKGTTPQSALSDLEISSRAEELRLSSHFPLPPNRPIDHYASPDARYRAVYPLEQPPSPFPQLRATKFLPDRCLEGWFAQGEMMCTRAELGEEDELDVTYLWVNGSDSRWKNQMIRERNAKGVYSPEHHFRENNELMYSMRSVLANMPGHLRTIHLITADYQFDSRTDIDLIPPQPEVWEELEELAEREFAPDGRWTKSGKATARPEREGLEARAGGPVEGLIHANAQYRPEKISNKLSGWFDSAWRVAQVPTWLEFSRVDLADPHHPLHHLYSNPFLPKKPLASHLHALTHPSLRYAVHTEIFHLPSHKKSSSAQQMLGLGASEWKEDTWRENALPTFNSMAIESRIGWLWGLADVSLSFNDDFFMLKPHAVADWFSGLYGTVLRLDYNYMQQVRPILDKKLINDAGESGGLYHANWLLSQRFPRRLRPYFAHVPKVITRGLHHEASLMFEEALTTSSQRKFRELPIGEGDVQMQWLLTALRIERWREALLWTWVVGKVGTRPIWEGKGNYLGGEVGMWGEEAREEISNLFGLGDTDDDVVKIEVHRGERWTMERDRMTSNFENAGWEPPKNTEMLWSSLDGHIPPLLKPGVAREDSDRCSFDLDRCFGRFWSAGENVTSDEMFKRLAFSYPACGDCMITALVTASGPLGLSAFFPPVGLKYKTDADDQYLRRINYLPPPHLPLTSTWQEADFSLKSVLSESSLPGEPVNLRRWTMQLLSRYLYISGRSPSHFHMAKSPQHVSSVFQMVDNAKDVALLGFNDDIETDYELTRSLMIEWFEKRWPEPAVWEKNWKPKGKGYWTG